MTSIVERLRDHSGPALSVEFFPPKTEAGEALLRRTIDELDVVDLAFVSVTYGAGGSTRDRTRDLVVELNRDRSYPAMAHLTCIGHTKEQLTELLEDYDRHGVHNILALAGDPPADGSDPMGEFRYAAELVELVREQGDFSIGVAAFPELHPRSGGARDADRRHVAAKLAMADFAITQFFADADDYARLVDDLAALGNDKPVLPGIMPPNNPAGYRRMAAMNGTRPPEALLARIEAADPADALELVVEATTAQCARLLELGAPGLHFYTLNRADITSRVHAALGL